MKSIFPAIVACLIANGHAQTIPSTSSVLLQFDFSGANPWPQLSAAGDGAAAMPDQVGTIDVAGSKDPSGGVRLKPGNGTAAMSSSLLAVQNSETRLAKLTLGFSLSVAVVRPVTVRIESFDAEKRRSGVLEKIIYPAAPDYLQRFALDLDTMKSVGNSFVPTDPFVSFIFEISGADIIHNTAYFNSASPELNWGQIFGSRANDIRIINNIVHPINSPLWAPINPEIHPNDPPTPFHPARLPFWCLVRIRHGATRRSLGETTTPSAPVCECRADRVVEKTER